MNLFLNFAYNCTHIAVYIVILFCALFFAFDTGFKKNYIILVFFILTDACMLLSLLMLYFVTYSVQPYKNVLKVMFCS